MSTVDDLKAVRVLIGRPMLWGKHAVFREGRRCIIGAIDHIAEGKGERGFPMFMALRDIAQPYDGKLSTWNDATERQHGDVMALIDKAIEAQAGAR